MDWQSWAKPLPLPSDGSALASQIITVITRRRLLAQSPDD